MNFNLVWTQLVAPFLKLFALCGSLAGVLLGLMLLVRSGPTLRYMSEMNRWVSSRRAMKSLEVPRGMAPRAAAGRRWVGFAFMAVGAYALGTLAGFDPAVFTAYLGAAPRYSVSAIVVDSLHWILMAGSAVAFMVGILMAFAPHLLASLEARANTWVSSRRILAGGDTMYIPFDRLAESYPRASGLAILALSLAAAAASAGLLLQR